MCGRFGFFAPPEVVAEEFDLPDLPSFTASYNIAPTEDGPTVGENPDTGERSFSSLRWGLIPFWSDDPEDFSSDLINARAETVHDKPAFRKPFHRRRCLVPASGFYEWKPNEDGKQPYWIHPTDNDLFAFAGLWDLWTDGENDRRVSSFTIITTEANETIAELHDRMPVVVAPEDYEDWLDPSNNDTDRLREVLSSPSPSSVDFHPVSRAMNNPGLDEPDCVKPLESTD